MANSLSGHEEQWQNILQTLANSANDFDAGFVNTFEQGVQALTSGQSDQVCLVRVGNRLKIEWEPTSVLK